MKQYPLFFLCLFVFLPLLSSCAPFKPGDKRAAICNELNSQMIFSGRTSNARAADIQNSEDYLVQRSYQKQKCDQK